MKRLSMLLWLCLLPALPAAAQVHGGSITGMVKDEQGGVLPGATVTAQGIDATQSSVTTSDGAFHFLDLAPGSYKITTGISGFPVSRLRVKSRPCLVLCASAGIFLPL